MNGQQAVQSKKRNEWSKSSESGLLSGLERHTSISYYFYANDDDWNDQNDVVVKTRLETNFTLYSLFPKMPTLAKL